MNHAMRTKSPPRKFKPFQKKIEALEKQNPRFKRVFTEYETMSEELWNLEHTDVTNIPDDFLDAIKLQTEYLKEEIDDWLLEDNVQ
jgi:uncharacterized protein YdcH (DUF465 family)